MGEIKRRLLSIEERQKVYDKCKGHCAYCGCGLRFNDMQVDHMIPLNPFYEMYMAVDVDLNDMSNLMPACRSCNHYKSTLTIEKFRQMLEGIPDRLMRDNCTFKIGERFGRVERKPRNLKFYFETMED